MNTPQPPALSPEPRSVRSPAVWLATGLGVGLVAVSPGTVGTFIWGMPLAWAISKAPGIGWQAAVIAILFAVGVPLCTAAGRALGGSKDNQAIVWDEIVTMPVVFLLVPLANWKVALAGFLLHRLFDITKPPPARQLEALPDGLGVMSDDLMAAIYACLALFGIAWLSNHFGWALFVMG